MRDAEGNQSIPSDSTDESVLTVIENDQSQEVDSTPAFTSAIALSEDLDHTDYDHTPAKLLFTIGPRSMKVGQEDQIRGRSIPMVWNTSGTTSQ